MAKEWTRETLTEWLESCDPNNADHRKALTRALMFLYARQTADEQSEGHTSHSNGQGFSGVDAAFLSSVARSAERWGTITPGQAPHVARKLTKYTRQLMEYVNARHNPPAEQAA